MPMTRAKRSCGTTTRCCDGVGSEAWEGRVDVFAGDRRAAKEALGITSGIVLDPCCGKGYTARAAVAHGLTFRGNELNPERAAVTVAWLEKHAR